MFFGGFGCEPGYENCGYDQESYVSYIDDFGAATYQNQKLRLVFKFMLRACSVSFMILIQYSCSLFLTGQHIFEKQSESNGPMGNDQQWRLQYH